MGLGRLVLLFTLVPALELVLLIEIGRLVGTFATVGLVLATGVLGAALARSQGLRVLGEVQREFGLGRLPAGSLVDGLLILIAGALLVTPGVLTDVVGLACLTPFFRKQVRRQLRKRFEHALREGRIEGTRFTAADGRIYEADFEPDPGPDAPPERPSRPRDV